MSTQLGGGVDIIVPTRSSPLPDTSPEPAAALASSKSEKLTTNIFPDIELHVTRLILIPLSLNKIESEELVVDDVEKSFDNNEVSYENLGETIAVTKLGELFNRNTPKHNRYRWLSGEQRSEYFYLLFDFKGSGETGAFSQTSDFDFV